MKSTLDQSTKENEGFSGSNVAANGDISEKIVNNNDEGEGKKDDFSLFTSLLIFIYKLIFFFASISFSS